MSRIDEELRLSREAHERHAALYSDDREFIREMTLRMHRDSQALTTSLNVNTDKLLTAMLDQRAEMRDSREQLRANTAAVLKVLDRLLAGADDPA